MTRFAIKLTHGDNVKILGIRDTKEEAMALGMELRKQHSRDEGLLAVIEAEFTDDGKMLGNGYRLIEVFR